MSVISMKQLLEAGVHFGHQTRRWNPKMSRFIFTERNGIYIIDLQKTVKKVEEAYKFVKEVAETGKPILFVGTKKQAQEAIKEEAERCGMYFVNERWLGGMLTNHKTIQTRINKLRELERMISKIVRKVVTNKIKNNKRLNLTINNIEEYLGKRIYDIDKPNSDIGIVNGLAYTNTGGDILPIEVNHFKGNGNLIITGSLGDVMVESAKVALSYVKSNYKEFGIDYKLFDNDIHINVPNIAIKKEGPSAGITLVTAIISDLTNLKIRDNIAFTGEITLRGNVIKIGSLKEKVIGAYINNIKTIFIPFSNLSDLEDINDDIKNKIEFIPVKRYDEIYKYLMGENNGR